MLGTMKNIGVGIFVKTPGFSQLKTRLAQSIGIPAAYEVYRWSVANVFKQVRSLQKKVDNLCPYWLVQEQDQLSHPLWSEFDCLWQGVGDLGEKLERLEMRLLDRHDAIFFLGSDLPFLPLEELKDALAQLKMQKGPACLLGPALDGGFWGYGANRVLPKGTWRSVPYSLNDTCQRLYEKIPKHWDLKWLSKNRDIDSAEDLKAYERQLQRDGVFL